MAIIFLNFKAYEQGTGKKALEISKAAERISKGTGTEIILMVQPTDVRMISNEVKLNVFSQIAEPFGYGSYTGHIIIESLKEAGAKGAMVNHSESRMPMESIKAVVEKAKKLNFKVLVCVESLKEAEEVAKLKPDYIALEDKELIGSGKSITEAMPESVKKFSNMIKGSSIPLCGAGISTKEDMKAAEKLGARGVLLASAVMKSNNPEKALKELAR